MRLTILGLLMTILSCKTAEDASMAHSQPNIVSDQNEVQDQSFLPPVSTEFDPVISPDPLGHGEIKNYKNSPMQSTASMHDAPVCFDRMPEDKQEGPFFREQKETTFWRGRKRIVVARIPVKPPESGLNLCRTLQQGCISCESWNQLHPESIDDTAACDIEARACSDKTELPCKCVRSL